uniref:NADH-ubiquinone oxidoreductase chain 2 n=1 Tax=Columbicola passerinae TaxID=128994 RepID=A0A6G8QS09_9NEOP|nr:NADH dehydrogenase subunit 2 [Columbicola passerinae]
MMKGFHPFHKSWVFFSLMVMLFFVGSSSWFSLWVLFEIFGWFFVGFFSKKSDSFFYSISLWKIFFFSFLSSSVIFLSFSLSSNQIFTSPSLTLMFTLGLMMKVGVPPFHGWVVVVSENLPMSSFFLFNFFLKFGPVMSFVFFLDFYWQFSVLIILLALGSVGGWNLYSTHRFLVYSSMSNLSWVFSSLFCGKVLFVVYFCSYSLVFFFFLKFLTGINDSKISSPSHTPSLVSQKMMFMLGLMNIMGVPPFLLFFVKFSVIEFIICSSIFLALTVISFTVVFMYMYIGFFSNQLFSKPNFVKKNLSYPSLLWTICFLSGIGFVSIFSCYKLEKPGENPKKYLCIYWYKPSERTK